MGTSTNLLATSSQIRHPFPPLTPLNAATTWRLSIFPILSFWKVLTRARSLFRLQQTSLLATTA